MVLSRLSRIIEAARVVLEAAHLVAEIYDRWAARKHNQDHPQQINYVFYGKKEEDGNEDEEEDLDQPPTIPYGEVSTEDLCLMLDEAHSIKESILNELEKRRQDIPDTDWAP